MRLAVRPQLAFAFVFVASVAAAATNGRRAITETDLHRFVWVADPQISPDGRQVAFVRVTVNDKKDGYDTAIWMVPADASAGPRAFTSGRRDSSPRWSPDGSRIAFIRATERDGKTPPPQIHVIAANGGEARSLTDLPKGARSARLVSRRQAAGLHEHDDRRGRPEAGARAERRPQARRPRERRPRDHARRLPLQQRGLSRSHPAGARLGARPARAGGQAKRAAPGDDWLVRRAGAGFLRRRPADLLHVGPGQGVVLRAGRPGPLQRIRGRRRAGARAQHRRPDRSYAFDRQGKRIAFTGSLNAKPTRSFDQNDLFLAEGPGGAARNLTGGHDFDVGDGIAGDQHAPRGALPTTPLWSADGRSVFVRVAEQGRANLKRVDVTTGKVDALTTGDQELVAYTASADGSRVAAVISTATEINDLYALDAGTGKATRLTQVNQALMDELDLPAPEEIWYTSFDGRKIHGWIQKPPGFDPAKKYPFILQIHGGPHAAYGHAFYHEFHWMAAKGYVVLYTNPRGSSSYGQEFGNLIQYAYPGDDHQDLMAGVDEVVRRGYVDETKLGITGGSGGGVLTNWAITQTDRFKAAVSQRSIADWTSFWYTADFSQFQPSWFKGAPWEDPQDFAQRSAITHVAKVKTPLMLIEGDEDWRTPAAAGGEQMFRALKYLKKPVVMVRFPEESHDLSRTGTPWRRVERLRHILNWFDIHLQGKKLDTYDVP